MHKVESVLENESHRILWDFEIQKCHTIQTRTRKFVVFNKKNRHQVDLAVPDDQLKKKLKTRQIPWPCLRIEEVMEYEGNGDTNRS